MARLAALVPPARVNLTRYHGVFAPNHRLREQVTPTRPDLRGAETPDEPAPARHVSMTWAQRLKRVFKIDDLRPLWWCGQGDREHRRASRDQPDPGAPRPARRAHDPSLQAVRPRAAANDITEPEGTRLTVERLFSCQDAKRV